MCILAYTAIEVYKGYARVVLPVDEVFTLRCPHAEVRIRRPRPVVVREDVVVQVGGVELPRAPTRMHPT